MAHTYDEMFRQLQQFMNHIVARLPNAQERILFQVRGDRLWKAIQNDDGSEELRQRIPSEAAVRELQRLFVELQGTEQKTITPRYPWILDPESLSVAHLFDLMTQVGASFFEGDCQQIEAAHSALQEMRTGVITELLNDCTASDIRLVDPAALLPERSIRTYHQLRRRLSGCSPIWREYYRGIGFKE